MVIVAGGSSTRFGADKLMTEIAGKPLIAHTIDAVVDQVDLCVVACRVELVDIIGAIHPDVRVTAGGATRTISEMAGLAAIGAAADLIGVHDAARPLVPAALIDELFEVADSKGGAVPLVDPDRLILDRRTHEPLTGIKGAQTPQVFRGPELMAAYVRAAQAGFEGHDTLEVVERFGDLAAVAVEGDPANIKVTYPSDLDEVKRRLSGSSRT